MNTQRKEETLVKLEESVDKLRHIQYAFEADEFDVIEDFIELMYILDQIEGLE